MTTCYNKTVEADNVFDLIAKAINELGAQHGYLVVVKTSTANTTLDVQTLLTITDDEDVAKAELSSIEADGPLAVIEYVVDDNNNVKIVNVFL